MKLYFSVHIRALVICSNGYALVLREAPMEDSSCSKCFIQFTPESQITTDGLEEVHKQIYGFIGLIRSKGETFAGFITERRAIGDPIGDQMAYQICDTMFVNFKGEIASYYKIQSEDVNGDYISSGIYSITKLLATGTFYYSPNCDLALSLEDRNLGGGEVGGEISEYSSTQSLQDDYPGRFVWNCDMIDQLSIFRSRLSKSERLTFDFGLFYITIIRGFVGQKSTNGNTLMIISRQDARKYGPLFGPAGMDDEGNVANFVESELILQTENSLSSYKLIRGNVPLFWKLDSHLLSTKVEFERSEDGTKHAFNRFFEGLCAQYGRILILDALSNNGSQPEMSERYLKALNYLHDDSTELQIGYKKLGNPQFLHKRDNESYYRSLVDDQCVVDELSYHGAFVLKSRQSQTQTQTQTQLGTVLVSSLDSIDRSNYLMMKVSEIYLQNLFGKLSNIPDELWFAHHEIWTMNGNALGKLANSYNASIKTKNKTGGLIGKVAEQGKKYISSSSQGGTSSGRQHQLDRLLGRKDKEKHVMLIDLVHDYVFNRLQKRRADYATTKELLIYCVTFNVNAIAYEKDLTEFLFPEKSEFDKYDLVVIALEEVIELTPSKVMSIDPAIRSHWEKKLNDTLNKNQEKAYSFLRSEQLGGILLLVFSNLENVDNIKNVESSVKKTGFKGISANKGGVAISFNYSSHSRLCFIGSHLAAGQNHEIERHQNYKTISKGIKFKRQKGIKDSDILIWMGDMNYRIDLPGYFVRKLLKCKPLSKAINNNEETSSSDYEEEYSNLNQSESNKNSLENLNESNSNKKSIDALESEFSKAMSIVEKKGDLSLEEEEFVLSKLFDHDQLNLQMSQGKSFPFFNEMEINFKPTYKFDKGTDVYDTSEKQRVPSWTDRIVYYTKQSDILKQIRYGSIPSYKFSDHKPVYGVFKANLEIVDDHKKCAIEQELYEQRKREQGYESILEKSSKALEKTAHDGLLKHGLPAPSSKENRWWRLADENKDEKSSNIVFPALDSGQCIINPNIPKNPFVGTTEPLFIGK